MLLFDAGSGGYSPSSDTYFEWNHTIGGGANRMLVVTVSLRVATATSVTFNGVNCNFLLRRMPGSDVNVEMWYMRESTLPAAGTYTIRVDLDMSQEGCGFASSWENAHQTMGEYNVNDGTGTTSSVSITENAIGSVIVDGIAKQSVGTLTCDENQTLVDSQSSAVNTGGMSYKAGTGAGTTMGWEVTDTWAAIALVINESRPVVTLGTPTNGDVIGDYAPDLTFTGTDVDSDDIEYNVQIDPSSGFESWLFWWDDTPSSGHNWGKVSASDPGFLASDRGYRLWYYDGASWTEQRPLGDVNRNWSDVGLSGTKMIASDNKGGGARLWYYDGASWAETRPCGDVNKNWVACDIDGISLVAIGLTAGGTTGRLWYSTDGGSSWNEQRPAGDVDKAWSDICISGSEIVASVMGGRLYYYNGATWSEVQPYGAANYSWKCVAVDSGKILAGMYSNYTSQTSKLFYYDGASWEELVLTDTEYSGEEFERWTGVSISGDKMLACAAYNGVYYFNGDVWMETFPTGAPAGSQAWDGCDIDGDMAIAGYEYGSLYVCDVSDLFEPMINATSDYFPGFYHDGVDAHPFDSGSEITYTVQFSQKLTPGTYYWRVRGKDPEGSNQWGYWSSTRVFYVSDFSPDNTEHSIESDNISLVQHHILSVQNSEHGLESSNIFLNTILILIDNAEHSLESDNIILACHQPTSILRFLGVSIDDIDQIFNIDEDTISKILGVFNR